MPIRQITIVGTGLIGGSFGLALRAHGFVGSIVGCDKPAVLEVAQQRRAIDRAEADLERAIERQRRHFFRHAGRLHSLAIRGHRPAAIP